MHRSGEEGQAILEYIFLLAITSALAVGIATGVLSAVDQSILKFGGTLEKQLKTGRTPASVWEN